MEIGKSIGAAHNNATLESKRIEKNRTELLSVAVQDAKIVEIKIK